MIIIVDYGLGNVRSIFTKIAQMDEEVKISNQICDLESADRLILPGVGAFDTGIDNLRKLEIIPILDRKIMHDHTPVLGICLGMQLLSTKSEEGNLKGLAYLNAETIRFHITQDGLYRIPHMGWNTIHKTREIPQLLDLDDNSRFYFVHSYHLVCNDIQDIAATTTYNYNFPSIIQRKNILGVQFHPEKSHKQGILLLKNFARGDF